jgi:hypothetical protein
MPKARFISIVLMASVTVVVAEQGLGPAGVSQESDARSGDQYEHQRLQEPAP